MYEFKINENKCNKIIDYNGSVPIPRSGSKGVSINEMIYVFGGYKPCEYFNDFLKYDPGLNTWTKILLSGD